MTYDADRITLRGIVEGGGDYNIFVVAQCRLNKWWYSSWALAVVFNLFSHWKSRLHSHALQIRSECWRTQTCQRGKKVGGINSPWFCFLYMYTGGTNLTSQMAANVCCSAPFGGSNHHYLHDHPPFRHPLERRQLGKMIADWRWMLLRMSDMLLWCKYQWDNRHDLDYDRTDWFGPSRAWYVHRADIGHPSSVHHWWGEREVAAILYISYLRRYTAFLVWT